MSVLSQSMLEKLGEQYSHETHNSLRYYQFAIFAEFAGLTGCAKLFRSQAEGERGHADKIMNYVIDKNAILPVSISFMDPDVVPSENVVRIFEQVLALEVGTTAKIESLLENARAEKDYMTEQWLLDPEGLVKEQVEEENLAQTVLDRIRQMGTSSSLIHDLDVWISEMK